MQKLNDKLIYWKSAWEEHFKLLEQEFKKAKAFYIENERSIELTVSLCLLFNNKRRYSFFSSFTATPNDPHLEFTIYSLDWSKFKRGEERWQELFGQDISKPDGISNVFDSKRIYQKFLNSTKK